MRWWPVVLVLATGCNRIFSLEETYPIDARPDAVGCSGAVFAGPDPLTEFDDSATEFDPQVRVDGLEMWFAKLTNGLNETYVTTRVSSVARFSAPVKAPFDGPVSDYDPALSGDGLRLVFISDRTGDKELFEVTRESLGEAFGPPGAVSVPPTSTELDSVDLTDDGLRVYYANREGDLWTATRRSFGEPFVDAVQIATARATFPSASPDQRELFFSPPGEAQIWRVVRADASEPFDFNSAVRLRDTGGDADMAADGTTLTISLDNGIAVMTRPCM